MKKILCLMLACILCVSLVFTACADESTEKATRSAEVTQADIEEKIISSMQRQRKEKEQ